MCRSQIFEIRIRGIPIEHIPIPFPTLLICQMRRDVSISIHAIKHRALHLKNSLAPSHPPHQPLRIQNIRMTIQLMRESLNLRLLFCHRPEARATVPAHIIQFHIQLVRAKGFRPYGVVGAIVGSRLRVVPLEIVVVEGGAEGDARGKAQLRRARIVVGREISSMSPTRSKSP